jgi:hypothetical protein
MRRGDPSTTRIILLNEELPIVVDLFTQGGNIRGVVAKLAAPKIRVAIQEVAPKSTPASITAPVPRELTTPAQSEGTSRRRDITDAAATSSTFFPLGKLLVCFLDFLRGSTAIQPLEESS